MSDAREGAVEAGVELAKMLAEEGGDAALDLFSPATKVVMGIASRYRKRIVDKMVGDVVRLLDHDDGEMSAQRVREIREKVGVTKFDEAIMQGLQLVLTACDELARDCISILVADHARGLRSNRDYQLAGKLLVESDEIMLHHLERITRMYVDVLDRIVSPEITERYIATHWPSTGEQWIWVFAGHSAWGTNGAAASRWERVVDPAFDVAISALQRVDFGVAHTESLGVPGMPETDGQSGGRIFNFIGARHDERIRALNRYLQPVRLRLGKL